MDIHSAVQQILPELVELRRELHAHPELRFEEQWTSDRISRFLFDAGIKHTRGHARGTGIVATLPGDSNNTVVLRSDIDALEIPEKTGLPYASNIPNRMHACGHDGHIASLCGAAKTLARIAEKRPLPNPVKFVFQPGEELGAGGRCIVEEGLIDGAAAAFALHAWPGIPVGRFGVRSGPVMASADWFRTTVTGRGCHGADPAAGVDPVVVASHIVVALQSIVSREIDPLDAAVVTIGKIAAGAANNVIPETAVIEGSYRALDMRVRDTITKSVQRIASSVALAHKATAETSFGEDHYIPLVNDPEMTQFARETIGKIFGHDAVVEVPRPSMASEDFAFYLEKVPGSFVILGMGDAPPLHSPYFNFNDEAMPYGVKFLAALATEFAG